MGPEKALGARPSYPCRLTTTRQIPLAEAGGIRKRFYLPPLGGEEEEGRLCGGGWDVQEGKGVPSRLLHHDRSQRGGVAAQGEAPSAIVSVRILS